jgi:hypothetical protein
MSEVARKWRDHEEVQHYASTAVACLVQAETSPHPKSKEKKPAITMQQQMMLSGQTRCF